MQPTLALRMFRPTMRMMRPVPVCSGPARSSLTYCDCSSYHQSAPTRSQKNSPGVDPPWYANYPSKYIRGAKLCPGIVVGVAVGAAFYSLGRKLVVDKTMRLNRQNRE
ncbi:hypothetical protein LOCC1_G000358 [Lachnellula occidentalis]|uniref:Uncharacterized protein n=1 Tax=Lachnellula occidentalis TaxID=215460 RepID=A0A8H8S7M7_9HELO|nr:hypothetical protein LOCC1_G000358 [Lachnellula occidentalis]